MDPVTYPCFSEGLQGKHRGGGCSRGCRCIGCIVPAVTPSDKDTPGYTAQLAMADFSPEDFLGSIQQPYFGSEPEVLRKRLQTRQCSHHRSHLMAGPGLHSREHTFTAVTPENLGIQDLSCDRCLDTWTAPGHEHATPTNVGISAILAIFWR